MTEKITVLRGSEFLPEGRAGDPKTFDGLRFVHVWYTTEVFTSNCEQHGNKRGCEKLMEKLRAAKVITSRRSPKTVLYQRVRYVWYREGTFYAPDRSPNHEREGSYAELSPIDGTIWTCYPQWQSKRGIPDATIRCEGGRPVEVTVNGETFAVTDESWPTMESFLGLDESWKPARYRKGA